MDPHKHGSMHVCIVTAWLWRICLCSCAVVSCRLTAVASSGQVLVTLRWALAFSQQCCAACETAADYLQKVHCCLGEQAVQCAWVAGGLLMLQCCWEPIYSNNCTPARAVLHAAWHVHLHISFSCQPCTANHMVACAFAPQLSFAALFRILGLLHQPGKIPAAGRQCLTMYLSQFKVCCSFMVACCPLLSHS